MCCLTIYLFRTFKKIIIKTWASLTVISFGYTVFEPPTKRQMWIITSVFFLHVWLYFRLSWSVT